ncbi:SDR family oxidoreductase [Flavobacterium sp. DG1-102-2]|uniref:SDR family oxidoreductase n=1 Tax=Flavobacterium sp. DG1-102-2 TaxID=3081663 RepID=UPI0029497D3B|nr:SDR family oxidoreductase [Flavobacterium sp. DG1-102-2]MDV6168233.1 SDR family oxidoreductase [Flavobacterium sp. DG1-102-2]
MRVFVTGASGFVGSAVVNELVSAGHKVLGLVRSESNAKKLEDAGAEACLGDVNDLDAIKKCAAECDAVIHTAFNHDFSQYNASCEADRKVIEAFGDALLGTDKPLVITSGIGLLRLDRLVTEDDSLSVSSDVIPRAASEEAAKATTKKGVNTYVVRLPPTVHGAGDYGFVYFTITMAKANGKSAYIGNGSNQWPAVHRLDAAKVYRLIVEQKLEQKTFHPVAEQGIPFKDIAETIGRGLNLPTVSLTQDEAEKHFTWFTHFAAMDVAASGEKTRRILGWEPTNIDLISDMEASYF